MAASSVPFDCFHGSAHPGIRNVAVGQKHKLGHGRTIHCSDLRGLLSNGRPSLKPKNVRAAADEPTRDAQAADILIFMDPFHSAYSGVITVGEL